MSDLIAPENLTQQQWQELADQTGVEIEILQKRIDEVARNENRPTITSTIGTRTEDNGCVKIPFEISLFGVIGLKFEFEFCRTASGWSAKAKVCITVVGKETKCEVYKFDPDHIEFCSTLDLYVASLRMCFGVNLEEEYFYIRGRACDCFQGCEDFEEKFYFSG